VKVAVLQMATSADPEGNAAKVGQALQDADARGARLLVVPECALSGYLPARDLDFDALAAAEARVVEQVADVGLWLALGTTRLRDGSRRNTAVLYCPGGEVVGSYEKTHLTGADTPVFEPGDELPVFPLDDWTVGLQICFDMRFPENWRILRRKGAELIIHLSNASRSAAWKVPVLEGAVRSRAAENGMFVASANDARAPQMMVSAVCDPDGRDLARAAENEETLLVAELDRSGVKDDFLAVRRTDLWDRPEHRRLLLG
jgi:predicted amidohydrolase